jgi:4a-hydroxytetrahydrobiopterin dehydratase
MAELASMHCTRIETNTPMLNQKEISQLAGKLPGWQVVEKDGVPRLERSFKFVNFREAMDFSDRVARAADEEDHHPAILTEWGKVTISWWSHRIKGLHQNDFIMAAKTSQIYGD